MERHLTDDQLDEVFQRRALRTAQASIASGLDDNTAAHLATCESCQLRLEMREAVVRQWTLLTRNQSGEPLPGCPSEGSWMEIVAGCFNKESEAYLDHAAHCDSCGLRLKAAAETLDPSSTAEEISFLNGLRSTGSRWQRSMARRLAAIEKGAVEKKRAHWQMSLLFDWHRLAFPVAALALVAVGAWLAFRILRPASVDQLLAQAYTEKRTLEVRIPDARYAPVRIERATGESNLDKPAALLKAETLIAENLKTRPTDPLWLDARGRAELLDGNYSAAVETLERALDSDPDSLPLLSDLGAAYYMRAESAGDAKLYGKAVESFGKVIGKDPDNPVVLFNRALACKQMFLYAQAIDDLEHYLRVDPQGDWSNEARSRLADVRARLEKRSRFRSEPLLSPSELSQISADSLSLRVEERFEDYLDLVVREWLPDADSSSSPPRPDHRDASIAAARLAQLSADRPNGDIWLLELISRRGRGKFDLGVRALAKAIRANDGADTVHAQQYARDAAMIFDSVGNHPGSLRARLESLVASNIDQNAAQCGQTSRQIGELLQDSQYHWLRAQFELEAGSCAWLRDDLGLAKTHYLNASTKAQESGFPQLYLRSQDHLAGLEVATGDFDAAWQTLWHGLDAFWKGVYPDVRGYNFYYNIYEAARIQSLPLTRVAAWRDGLRLNESSPDIAQRAIAHVAMANAAESAELRSLARNELDTAVGLFKQSRQSRATRVAWLEAEARLAGVEAELGDASRAISRLKPLHEEMEEISDHFLETLYFTSLGVAEGKQGEWGDAEVDLQHAVAFTDLQLSSVSDAQSRLQIVEQSSLAFRTLIQRELLKGDTEAALGLWEEYRSAPVRRADGSTHLQGSFDQEARQHLRQHINSLTHETIISIARLPLGLAIWSADNRGVFVNWQPGDGRDTLSLVHRFRNQCANPKSDVVDLKRIAQTVYERLIAPFKDRLELDRTLIAELDAGFAGIPLEALVDDQGRYFGSQTQIETSLGMYYYDASHTAEPVLAAMPAVVAAVPRSVARIGEYSTLPGVIEEGEMVAATFRRARFLGPDQATRRSVLSSLRDALVFHFAGHGISTPRGSGLLLSDGLLSPQAIPPATLSNLQIAVLSACETEYGDSNAFDDDEGLVRTFLGAGVPHVVASRWKVDSVSTLSWMRVLYANLLLGKSVAASTHIAQDALRSHPQTSHPYYWSAFGAYGSI